MHVKPDQDKHEHDSQTKKEIVENITNLQNILIKNSIEYGDAFGEAEDFLQLLFPDGIPADKLGDVSIIIRLFDKIKRISHAKKPQTTCDAYKDIAGYAIIGLNLCEEKMNDESP